MEGLIVSNIPTDNNPAYERQLAVQSLEAAARDVRKAQFGSDNNRRFAYVNNGGGCLVDELRRLNEHVEGLDQIAKRNSQLAEQHWKADEIRSQTLEKKLSEVIEALSEERMASKKTSEELVKVQQRQISAAEQFGWCAGSIRQVAIDIRRRFYSNFRKSVGRATLTTGTEIHNGNAAAHEGDVVADATLISCGDLMESKIFAELYGISHRDSISFFESESMVKALNRRATILANAHLPQVAGVPGPRPQWSNELQSFFDTLISFAETASPAQWAEFHADTKGRSQARRAWYRVYCA